MSLFKPPLLILSALSYNMALQATTTPTAEDKVMGTSLRERMWKYAAIPTSIYLKAMMWAAALAESAAVVGSLWSASSDSDSDLRGATPPLTILSLLGPADASQLTVPFVTGALFVIAGGVIRCQCYRALGPFFTAQQILRKDHKLITSGPYAVVRHPGYVSLMMCVGGSCLMYATPGSWLTTSRVWSVPWVRTAVGAWCILMVASVITLFHRVKEEDLFLAERFGKEWEAWARRVKYKLVPFVY